MAINPEKVLQQIGTLWADLARDSEKAEQALTRACALTLVVLADAEEEAGDDVSPTLAAVMHTHPSRAIVIRVRAGDGEVLEADVRAQCWRPPSGHEQVCSEEVVIECSERTLADVVSLIDVLRAADLPAVLWCRSERAFRNPAFTPLAAATPRVIMETARFADPIAALRQISSEMAEGRQFTDLSWTRITRWRELVAQSFDNVVCGQPGNVTSLRVRYLGDCAGPAPASGLLFAGWIAQSLNWNLDAASGSHNGAASVKTSETEIRFERCGDGGSGSHLEEVEISSQASPVSIRLQRVDGESLQVRVDLEGCPPMEHRVAFPPSDEVSVLNEELRYVTRDAVFEASLRAAVRLAELAA